MTTFHDELAALCKRHSKDAEVSDDRRVGYSNMIVNLSAALGRTVGLAADGDMDIIGRILITVTSDFTIEATTTATKLIAARWKTEGTA